MNYHRTISDYISEIEIVENDKVVGAKDVEVNHPLHFGGYHFYQSSYDDKAERYTVLSVHADTGLFVVYAGYWLLCLGIIWHLWLRHVLARIRSKSA
jgi:cytochrome c biogenesis protein ResB